MSNTMTAHEPINYLDSILNEEEKRCEYSHQWRNFTISRSGRFKSKNKHRNAVDGKMFDHTTATTSSSSATAANSTSSYNTSSSADKDKISTHYGSMTFGSTKSYQNQMSSSTTTKSISSATSTSSSSHNRQRDKMDTYKSYYETNL